MEINSKEVRALYEAFTSLAEPAFIQYVEKEIRNYDQFVKDYEKQFKKISAISPEETSMDDMVQMHIAFRKSVLEMLDASQQALQDGDFTSFFGEYTAAVGGEIEKLNKTFIRREKYVKYPLRRSDGPVLIIRKAAINVSLFMILSARRVMNIILRLLKMSPLPLEYSRKRRIPFKNMARHYLQVEFPQKALDNLGHLFKLRSQAIRSIWDFDENSNDLFELMLAGKTGEGQQEVNELENPGKFFREIRKANQEMLKEISARACEQGQYVLESFDQAFQRVDTLDLPVSFYHVEKIKSRQEEVNAEYARQIGRWKNTFHTMFDDWAVDVEIIHLYYSVNDRYHHLKSDIDEFISSNLNERFTEIRSFIRTSTRHIRQSSPTKKETIEVIREERKKVNKQLINKILARAVEDLTGCFIDDFEQLLSGTLALTSEISDKRGFVRTDDYGRGIRDSEISTISPRELLDIKALPGFKQSVTRIKEVVESHLEKVRFALITLGTVCDFNLESAVMLMTTEKKGTKEAIETAVQGYDRALKQLASAQEIINEIQGDTIVELRHVIHSFNQDIQKLKNTENVFGLQMKIARIKAREHSQQIKKKVFDNALNIVPSLITDVKKAYSYSGDLIKQIKVRTGMTAEKATVSFELMEFINETQLSLKKLPYVYQRLYQIQPTDEERFFVNRKNELGLLGECLENWKKGRYINCSIIGEKGSGTTSLVNYFLLNRDPDVGLYKHTLREKIYTDEKYFGLLNSLLGTKEFQSNGQFIDYLNDSPDRQIIVLENLQHMFLKKVNGFDCIKLLFELMSHTSQKVLWVGVFTPASWEYLDKTVSISNYFSDEIRLKHMSDETIREIIYKRNRLSGYQIQFTPGEEQLHNKVYQKQDEEGKKIFLQDQFFSRLNQLSNGNISLAQLYWLRSTLRVDEQFIHIGTISQVNFSFVKNLSGDSLFALQVLLLHDGLTLEAFAETMNQPVSVCRNLLIPMLEKGLLIRPKQKFNINPIIYRTVYDYLSSRNFIH